MDAHATIRSRSNPLLQRVGAVRAGREPGTLLLEGERLVADAIRAGHRLEIVLVEESRRDRAAGFERAVGRVQLVEDGLLQKVTALKTSPGVLALCPAPPRRTLDDLELAQDALVLVVAGVGDPGNLGALARAAEAFGAHVLVALRGGASPWGEKALRGSMGSLLRLPVCADADAGEVARALEKLRFRQLAAATRGGADPRRFDWRGRVALWIAGEAGVLPAEASRCEPLTIRIAPAVESLNVAVAAALLLYQAGRVPPAGDA